MTDRDQVLSDPEVLTGQLRRPVPSRHVDLDQRQVELLVVPVDRAADRRPPVKHHLDRSVGDNMIGREDMVGSDDNARAVALGVLDQHGCLVQRILTRTGLECAGSQESGQGKAQYRTPNTSWRHAPSGSAVGALTFDKG
jgi:hypothetical protein